MSSIMPTYKRLPVTFERGEGALLFDTEGKAYLDGLSGIAVTNLGHAHPAVTRALTGQAQQLLHTSNLFRIAAQEQLADTLSGLTGMERMFFCNSGTEANETAIKLALRHGINRGIDAPRIVVLEHAFHGRTLGSLSATGNTNITTGFGPLLPNFVRVATNDLEAVRALSADPSVIAVLAEPIQGEGGVRLLDLDYLEGLRALCDSQGWLLMFDEVQSGNGRCGAPYAFLRLGVTPDVMTTAKGLGNGVPIGCCMARGAAAEVLGPGDHGTTFGGSPLACSVGNAVMQSLADDGVMGNADPIRDALITGFQSELRHTERVADIRGLGLMIGIEVTISAGSLVTHALSAGALINVTAGNTIRLLPPLVMSEEQADQLGRIVANAVDAAEEISP